MAARKTHDHGSYHKGERHVGAKLTQKQVDAIRQTYANSRVTQRQLAEHFGVAISTIHKIIARKNWAD